MTKEFDLAIAQLAIYLPAGLPLLYCLWRHRSIEILGWFFLSTFTMLQVVGSAMVASAGENGTPSETALIIINVGISALTIGTAGILHEWAKLAGILRTVQAKKWAWLAVLVFHMYIAGAVALYAIGASDSYNPKTAASGHTLEEVGVVLLLLGWIGLCACLALLARRSQPHWRCKPLIYALIASLALIGARMIYQCVAVFDSGDPVFNPVTGSMALRIIFDFLTGVGITVVMGCGGILSINELEQSYHPVGAEVELSSMGNAPKRVVAETV